jgi:hypothetical protein
VRVKKESVMMIKGVVVEEKLVKGGRDEEEAKGLERRDKFEE